MTDRAQTGHLEQIQCVPPPASAWGAGVRSCRFPWSLSQRILHGMDTWLFPPWHDKGGPFLGLKNRRAAPKVAPVSLPPAGMVLSGLLAIVRPQHFLPSHGVCFSPSVLRFRLGRLPLAAERRLPSSVLGPVDRPPCRRHRPLPYRSLRLQGIPALVLAPHVWPGKVRGGGSGASSSSRSASRLMLAHNSAMLLASSLVRTGIPCIFPFCRQRC